MNAQDKVVAFLTGTMAAEEFISELKNDRLLRYYISKIVPDDAVSNVRHPYWNYYSYSGLKSFKFDAWKHICHICRFNNTISDNLNLFGGMAAMYKYYEPELPFTDMYDKQFAVYLEATQDCFEGSEVMGLLESIVQNALQHKTKTKQIQKAKQDIREAFHVEGRKRPRWIHGPDWPMGVNSPMEFINQKNYGEEVHYHFRDVDNGNIRTIVDYY